MRLVQVVPLEVAQCKRGWEVATCVSAVHPRRYREISRGSGPDQKQADCSFCRRRSRARWLSAFKYGRSRPAPLAVWIATIRIPLGVGHGLGPQQGPAPKVKDHALICRGRNDAGRLYAGQQLLGLRRGLDHCRRVTAQPSRQNLKQLDDSEGQLAICATSLTASLAAAAGRDMLSRSRR